MQARATPRTDFCIIGFPKCGTSALCRLLETFDDINIARAGDSLEAPFYVGDGVPFDAYVTGKTNGHKFSAYFYTPKALVRMHAENKDALFIICVRSAIESLLSWRNMHRNIAVSETEVEHFTRRDPETTQFYATCSLEEYFSAFAKSRLDYAVRIEKLLRTLHPKFAIVSQSRLTADAQGVLKQLRTFLGLPCKDAEISRLPVSTAPSYASRALKDAQIPESLGNELQKLDGALARLLEKLPRERCLTLDGALF